MANRARGEALGLPSRHCFDYIRWLKLRQADLPERGGKLVANEATVKSQCGGPEPRFGRRQPGFEMLAYSGSLIEGRLPSVKLLLKLPELEHHVLSGPAVHRPGLMLPSRPAEIKPPLPTAIGPVPYGALPLASSAGHCKCACACAMASVMVRGRLPECADRCGGN